VDTDGLELVPRTGKMFVGATDVLKFNTEG
jgi:hypothetical protein